ncbi:MAG: metallophosphoesterase [Candidatus Omnitrophica bacterium]|nr:metallophosphoesterase [Candidatus Omnitrophota bacterium]
MLLGIISDSHDNLSKIRRAVKLFNRKKVEFVLHLGDFVAPFSVRVLKELKCPWHGIFGNNDGEKEGLLKISEGKIKSSPLRIELNKRRITLVHDINTINLSEEKSDIIRFGHTHRTQMEKKDSFLLFNPGEWCGWITGRATIALLDLETLYYKIIKI